VNVDPTSVSGTWWRHIAAGSDVYYRPDEPADNRWQRGEVVEAWYFADSEPTAWAEWYRALAEAGLPPRQALPRDLWRWEMSLPEVADVTDEQRLARLELPTRLRPTRAQWPAFQPVGEALFNAGYPAILCPSAARPEGQVLCVFRTEREVPGAVPQPPPTRIDEPPPVPSGMTT
jgi:RES domain